MYFKKLNLVVSRFNPRGAVRMAKEHFGNKEIVCAEVGVYEGDNAKAILENLNVKQLFLIDPYENYYENWASETTYRDEQLVNAGFKVMKRFANKINNGQVTLIVKNSDDGFETIKEEKLDFVYIDANHNYDFVLRDMENYWTLLNEGGMLSGDDIDQPEVFRAVRDFSMNKNLDVRIWGRDWIIIKTTNGGRHGERT